MAITLVGSSANPADNSTLYDSAERSITLPASMVTGDLVILRCDRKDLNAITISNTGGQTWNNGTLRQGGSNSARIFWCRFNGTWSANPSITSTSQATVVITLTMVVYRPTTGTNTWALDAAEAYKAFSAPVSPFDVTATGRTTVAANTVAFASWQSIDVNTWGLQTAGWANAGSAQYRNPDASTARPISVSNAYKIQTSAGATGSPVNRQLTNGGDLGLWIMNTFKEQSSGVTVASASDGIFHDGETGLVIACTSAGASHTGSADVIISPSDNIADAGAVVQTQTAWSDTSVTFTAVLSSFSYFTSLYLFVKNSSGASNSSGFVIQREAVLSLTTAQKTLKNLAGTAIASASNVRYRVSAPTVNDTPILSAANGTTDGSGVMSIGSYTLVNGGTPAPGDDVWVVASIEGANQAASEGTCAKVTPTYA